MLTSSEKYAKNLLHAAAHECMHGSTSGSDRMERHHSQWKESPKPQSTRAVAKHAPHMRHCGNELVTEALLRRANMTLHTQKSEAGNHDHLVPNETHPTGHSFITDHNSAFEAAAGHTFITDHNSAFAAAAAAALCTAPRMASAAPSARPATACTAAVSSFRAAATLFADLHVQRAGHRGSLSIQGHPSHSPRHQCTATLTGQPHILLEETLLPPPTVDSPIHRRESTHTYSN